MHFPLLLEQALTMMHPSGRHRNRNLSGVTNPPLLDSLRSAGTCLWCSGFASAGRSNRRPLAGSSQLRDDGDARFRPDRHADMGRISLGWSGAPASDRSVRLDGIQDV